MKKNKFPWRAMLGFSGLLVVVFAIGALKFASEISSEGAVLIYATSDNQQVEGMDRPLQFQSEVQMMHQSIAAGLNDPDGHDRAAVLGIVSADFATEYVYEPTPCGKSGDERYGCFDEFYRGLTQKYGPAGAFVDLKQRYPEDDFIQADCHPLTHAIGQVAAGFYDTVSEAYLNGDSYCWSGYYHGIMEGVVEKIGLEKLPGELDKICADIPGRAEYTFDYYNCVHGLGHGIMETSGDQVFDSLKTCDILTGEWERQSCYSGVFMENIIADGAYHQTGFLRPEEPMYPCTAVEDRYKSQCYLGQTSYALKVTNSDYEKVFGLCAGLEPEYRDICNQSMGRDGVSLAWRDPAATKDTCWIAEDENDRKNCIVGAVKEFISYDHATATALKFCGLFDGVTEDECVSVANDYYSYF